jgi:hypothetical protein
MYSLVLRNPRTDYFRSRLKDQNFHGLYIKGLHWYILQLPVLLPSYVCKKKHTIMKKLAFILPIFLFFSSCSDNVPTQDTSIEKFYEKDGPNQVSTTIIKTSDGKNEYKIFYPSNLSDNTPLITWGNGSNTGPDDQELILHHMATWGYIVIDNYEPHVGNGEKIMEAVHYMLEQNSDPKSKFYRKVDPDRIAAVGGSQGAVGIVNAHTELPDGHLLKTLIPVAYTSYLPNLPEKIKVPVFFISGTLDLIVSTYAINKGAFDKIPDGVPAVLAMRKSAVHEEIGISRAQFGYLTAWLNYQLKADTRAEAAFKGKNPELLTNENWENAEIKNL